jgi:hypothetical protein
MSRRFVCPRCYVAQEKPDISQEMLDREREQRKPTYSGYYTEGVPCVSCRQYIYPSEIAGGKYDEGISSAKDIARIIGLILFSPLLLLPAAAIVHFVLYAFTNIDIMAWGRTKLFDYMILNYYLAAAATGFCLGLLRIVAVVTRGGFRKSMLKWDENQ